MKSKIALWDIDFLPYYVCHNKKLDNGEVEEKSLNDCKQLTDDFITTVNLTINADYFIGCLTVGKCFRYNIYPEYKANRKYSDKPKHFDAIKEYLITKYNCNYNHNLEADDLVVIYKNQLVDHECIIISPDKDILMLEGKHYNPRINTWVYTNKQEANKHFWKSMITGDSVDNIKGLPGKGEKFADNLFKALGIDVEYYTPVFNEYLSHFGEFKGIEEFYKNYRCLNILDKWDGIELPRLINIEKEGSEEKGIPQEIE